MSSWFPKPVMVNGRMLFFEADTENYLRDLAGLPFVSDDRARRLITAAEFARKLNVTRRTLGKRLVAAGHQGGAPPFGPKPAQATAAE